MHTPASALDGGTTIQTDVCIVGSGPAGISIALELAKASVDVLLLESGGFDHNRRTEGLYDIEDAGNPAYPHMATRSSRTRRFGGTSSQWGGMLRPLDDLDFAPRTWVEHSGWPIGREDLEPFYHPAHTLLDAGPWKYDDLGFWEDRKAERLRLPLDEDRVETKIYQYAGTKRFGSAFRSDIVSSAQIRLVTEANLVSIETSSDGRSVQRLHVRHLDGREISVVARKVVLACGAIENARLLLASTSTSPAGVGNSSDMVGRFFMEHPCVYTATLYPSEDRHAAYLYGHFFIGDLVSRALLHVRESVQRNREILNVAAALQPTRQTGQKALRDILKGLTGGEFEYGFKNDIKWLLNDAGGVLRAIINSYRGVGGITYDPPSFFSFKSPLRLYIKLEQQPNPESRVLLSDECDELGTPLAKLKWRLTDLDRKTAREATRVFADTIERAGVARVELDEWVDSDSTDWPELEVWGHHIGTTKMGSDPSHSVVDPHCRVHGIDNLYVAGSSVFPTGGCVNPTLTIIALALRLAERLKH